MSATVQRIDGDECIGDSLEKINNNFTELSLFIAPNYTIQEISSRLHSVNTNRKQIGKVIFDKTNNRLLVATGPNNNSPWYVVDGSSSVTPS
jgi:hypothetical protein